VPLERVPAHAAPFQAIDGAFPPQTRALLPPYSRAIAGTVCTGAVIFGKNFESLKTMLLWGLGRETPFNLK
jgi:hypothetical protein